MDSLRDLSLRAVQAIDRLPPGVEALVLLGLVVLLAWAAHKLFYRFVVPRIGARDTLFRAFLVEARGLILLALALWFVGIVAPGLNLGAGVDAGLRHAVLIAIIAMVGWGVVLVVDLAEKRAIRRFRIDVADNLTARKFLTQIRILKRVVLGIVAFLTVAAILLTFDEVRKYGVSLFASAGVAGIVLGIAAKPVLSNLLAGIQIALTQPIRIEDVVIVEGEWGWIEEIFATFVVVRIWDLRRMVLPISYFIETPFQNWTRESATIIGSVFWFVDYTMPIDALRAEVERLIEASPDWDGVTKGVQVVDTDKDVMQVRALMSSVDSSVNFNLRCEVREKALVWIQRTHPGSLPRMRGEVRMRDAGGPEGGGASGGADQSPATA